LSPVLATALELAVRPRRARHHPPARLRRSFRL